MVEDLWPKDISDLGEYPVDSPAAILKAQGELLSKHTNRAVHGKVRLWTYEEKIMINFEFVVPAMENYSYGLFRAEHGARLYPIKVTSGCLKPYLNERDDDDGAEPRKARTWDSANESPFAVTASAVHRSW